MTAPNVEMIAASLRSCSLGARRERSGETPPPVTTPPHLEEASDESAGLTVELNSETALPSQWEQCLDMRTGELYYINWETGVRTTKDPRSAAAYHLNYYTSDDDDDDEEDADDTSEDDDYDSCSGVGGDEFDDTADSTSVSSTLSSVSPPEASASTAESHTGVVCAPGHGQILVAAGCKSCFMYFMVPKRVDACPKCGGGLLHLG